MAPSVSWAPSVFAGVSAGAPQGNAPPQHSAHRAVADAELTSDTANGPTLGVETNGVALRKPKCYLTGRVGLPGVGPRHCADVRSAVSPMPSRRQRRRDPSCTCPARDRGRSNAEHLRHLPGGEQRVVRGHVGEPRALRSDMGRRHNMLDHCGGLLDLGGGTETLAP